MALHIDIKEVESATLMLCCLKDMNKQPKNDNNETTIHAMYPEYNTEGMDIGATTKTARQSQHNLRLKLSVVWNVC